MTMIALDWANRPNTRAAMAFHARAAEDRKALTALSLWPQHGHIFAAPADIPSAPALALQIMAFASRNAAQAKQWADKRRMALEKARRMREEHSRGHTTTEHTFRPE